MTLTYQLTPADRAFCETVVCAGFHAVKYHTLQVVEALLDEGVPGDFAECGVLFGAHPAVMLYALKRRGIRSRRVHLFDSFQGIPRATLEDGGAHLGAYGLLGDKMESSGVSVSSVENTLGNLSKWGVYDAELVVVHPGWFEETLERAAQSVPRIALLRSDVDLYSSTRAVYQHLWNRVVPGAFVIDDDYGHHDGPVTNCRRAMEQLIGPQPAIEVAGQPDTSWWRKR